MEIPGGNAGGISCELLEMLAGKRKNIIGSNMPDEIRDDKLDQDAGKFNRDVKRFVEAEDWDGLNENISNRVKESAEKATDAAVGKAIDKFLERMTAENKFAIGTQQTDEEDGNKFKSIGEFAGAVAANPNSKVVTDPRLKALAEGTGADGGYSVPTDFQTMLSTQLVEASFFRDIGATVIPITGDKITITTLKDIAHNTNLFGGLITYWKAEAASLTEASFKLDEKEMTPHKITGLTYASNELLEDSGAMDALIRQTWAQAIAWNEDNAFINGTGIGQPLGILNSSALKSVSRSGASAVALSDVADMLGFLYPHSLGRAYWLINQRVYAELLQMTASNAIFISPDQGATKAPPTSIFGIPLKVTEHCPYLNTAGDIMLIDPSYYIIVEKSGMVISTSEHYRFGNDQTCFKVTHRVDGQGLVDSGTTLKDGTHTIHPFVALTAG